MAHTIINIKCSALLILFVLAGCAVSEESAEEAPPRRREPEGLVLARDKSDVRTIQLHAGSGETSLPIVEMGSGLTIRLAFDLMLDRGRPLTVFFYHTDRNWKRDLTPSEYLSGFFRDDILDYQSSQATFVDYYHYEYEFPNRNIDFRLSGNYILRVTEQGMEGEVLFERPFFVSEQSTPVDMRLDNVLVAGRPFSSIQPFIRFTPPNANTNVFDYSVCFLRNSWYQTSRCVGNPSLDVQPDLSYYLEPRKSFGPRTANYYVNVSDVRTGGRIERTDQNSIPWGVTLEPDYAKLGASGIAPFLNGQSLVREGVRSVADPDYNGEYIDVTLRLVPPDERAVAGRIFVTGSFSNWSLDAEDEMTWDPVRRWYEGIVSMKQGQHEYRYIAEDPALQLVLERGLPAAQNMFTTFVYFNDITAQTDRLIASQGIFSR